MTFRNFSLVETPGAQIIEINYLEKILDLHNAAEFVGVEYLTTTAELILSWNYYFNDGALVAPFQIRFDDVSSFEIQPRDEEMPRDEDDCLEQIIYREKIEFRFMGGMRIIIEAVEVAITSSDMITTKSDRRPLSEYLQEIAPENLHGETGTGAAVGRERL